MSKNRGRKKREEADAIILGREGGGLNQEDGSGERERVHFSYILCRGWTELDQRLENRVRDEKMLK